MLIPTTTTSYHHYNNKLCRQWCEKLCSFYRPPPLTSYHHLLDPASAAATRPLLLAAGLYGANSLALPPPIPLSPHAPTASILPTSNEDRRASSCGTLATGGPLDLSHLASNHHHQTHHHIPGLDNCNGALGGGAGSVGKLPSAASVHSFLQLHKSAGKLNKKKERETFDWNVKLNYELDRYVLRR